MFFRSSTACTDAREFIHKLRSRTLGLRPAAPEEPALSFQVELVPTSAGVRGQLQVREPDGTLAVRVIPASDCHEVLSAMALIAALMVDPFATNAPVLGPMPARPVPEDRASEALPSAASASVPPPFDFGFGQRLTGQSGVLPEATLGFSLFADLGYRFGDFVHPRLRIAGLYAQKSVTKLGAQAAFTWTSARLSACPLRFSWSAVELRPCAFWDAGSLRAEGLGTDRPEPATSILWSAAGVLLDGEALLVGPLALGGEVGVVFPLIRDRFFFAPDGRSATIHEVPAAGWAVALGLGLRLY